MTSEIQHLLWDRDGLRPICDSDDDPTESITAEEFREQLGQATGENTVWEAGEMVDICALCATRYVESQRRSQSG